MYHRTIQCLDSQETLPVVHMVAFGFDCVVGLVEADRAHLVLELVFLDVFEHS